MPRAEWHVGRPREAFGMDWGGRGGSGGEGLERWTSDVPNEENEN